MAHITYITGGARSGKSRKAQALAELLSPSPIYLATAHVWDADFAQRIQRHKNDRGPQWQTIEEEIELSKHHFLHQTVLLDCVTLWLTNIFHKNNYELSPSLEQAKNEWQKFIQQDFTLIVVSNELGMGLHADSEAGRRFTDLQGWMNQTIAADAQSAILMISGIALKLK